MGYQILGKKQPSIYTIAYNIRSIKLHEKVGFRQEGIQRSFIQREGQRFDLIQYGILRPEWEARQTQ